LRDLNTDITLDATHSLNNYILADENVSQFFQTNIKSFYYDTETFINKFKSSTEPLILSINIQSLNSKHTSLKGYIQNLLSANMPIDLIVLQETWEIKSANQLSIPGFQSILYRNRERGRGGGSVYMLDTV
jgi:hypothetical protein